MAPGTTKVVGRRTTAFLIDLVLTWIVAIPLFGALAERRPRGTPIDLGRFYARVTSNNDVYYVTGGRAAAFYGILLVLGLGYWVLLPGATGATLGQRLLGVRVVGEDGRPAGFGRNLVRQLLWIIDGLPWFIPFVVGFFTALLSRANQRVGDMVARTWVVRAGSEAVRDEASGLLASGLPDPAAVPLAIPGGGPSGLPGAEHTTPQAAVGGAEAAVPVERTPPARAVRPATPAAPGRTRGGDPLPAPGWYADPSGRTRLRWWDGARWTDHTAA